VDAQHIRVLRLFRRPDAGMPCTPPMVQRYVSKISGLLLDRIDIHIEVPAVKYKELREPSSSKDSASVRGRVIAAKKQADREVQSREEDLLQRADGAETYPQGLRDFRGGKVLENAVTRLGLSATGSSRSRGRLRIWMCHRTLFRST
jgi:magnesium chelatase family protein